jgi:hypothetical protein
MNKIKHNKFKNSGILFELLLRQIASDTLSNKDSAAVDIVKKFFNKTELAKEHKLYQTLINSRTLTESKAEILITSVLEASLRLNRSLLRSEKYNLIKEIRNHYNIEDFFKAKINNYLQYAAVYNLIEANKSLEFIEPSHVINNKITLLEYITRKDINTEEIKDKVLEEYAQMDKGTRLLVYKILLEKFNEKYSNLTLSQKKVLKEYINNVSNTTKLRDFVNTSYESLKTELIELNKKVEEATIKIKVNEVVNLLKPLDKTQFVKDENIIALLQYDQLVTELKTLK